jgi:hypothetical protein
MCRSHARTRRTASDVEGRQPRPESAPLTTLQAAERPIVVLEARRTVSFMDLHPTDQLYVSIEALNRFVAASSEPGADDAAAHLSTLVDSLVTLFAAPGQLEVVAEHRAAAVGLVTAYLDNASGHQLLVELLVDHDRRGRVDPGFRIGLVAALAQLTADALAAAAVVWAADADGDIDDDTLPLTCLALLQRIALLAGRNPDTKA